jgi:Tfp pilus assembly protein PilV
MLVAMSLFSVVASGMAAMAATSLRATANNRASTAAQMIAQDELEQVRGLDYPDIEDSASTVMMSGETYEVDTVVTEDDPADGMKRVVVTVGWTGPLGPRTYAIETIFTAIQ